MSRIKIETWLSKENLKKIEGWARDGLTDKEIAQNIGIDRTTFYRWGKKNSFIQNAVNKGTSQREFKRKKPVRKKTEVNSHFKSFSQTFFTEQSNQKLEKSIAEIKIKSDLDFKNESDLEDYFVNICHSLHWDCLKNDPFNRRGIPDRVIITNLGQVAYVELKNPKQAWELRNHQYLYIDYLKNKGRLVEVIFSALQIKPFLLKIIHKPREGYPSLSQNEIIEKLKNEDNIRNSPLHYELYRKLKS